MENCLNCKFFNDIGEIYDDKTGKMRFFPHGFCRRFPPQICPHKKGDVEFVLVFHSGWCGEWKAKEAAE